jgi:hypothetical protein
MGERQDAYKILVWKQGGRKPLGRPRHIFEDNIKMDLRKVGWDMDWIDLAQERYRWWVFMNSVMNLRFL